MASLKSRFSGFLRDKTGNFGILTALAMPLLCAAGGMTVDVTNMLQEQTGIQSVSDAASLAASSALSDGNMTAAQAIQLAKDYVSGQMGNVVYGIKSTDYTTTATAVPILNLDLSTTWNVQVKVSWTHVNNGLTQMAGWQKEAINVASNTTSISGVQNSFSMYFVLDRSGSMASSTELVKSNTYCYYYWMPDENHMNTKWQNPCYYNQIEVLQNATKSMFATFEKADPKHMYFRTGADSFAASADPTSDLAWGTSTAWTYISKLVADGGTASTGAFKAAYLALTNLAENTIQTTKNGILLPKKYIVFMTDGSNNNPTDDTNTAGYCKSSKTAGITVYVIAFRVPDKAKTLLTGCASSASTYFEATDGDDLQKAFDAIGDATTGATSRVTS